VAAATPHTRRASRLALLLVVAVLAGGVAAILDVAAAQSNRASSPTSPGVGAMLRIAGDDAIGRDLILPIAQHFLSDRGGSSIRISPGPPSWTWQVSGNSLLGRPLQVLVQGTTTGDAIARLIKGEIDIAVAGRQLDEDEIKALGIQGDIISSGAAYPLAHYGVIIAVNRSNPIKGVTFDQLRDIFAGRIADWKDLGGNPGPIHLLARDENAAMRRRFRGAVMGKVPESPSVVVKASYQELHQAVVGDPGAIGLLPRTYESDVSSVKLMFPDGRWALSDRYGAGTGDYPLQIPVSLYRAPTFRRAEATDFFREAQSAAAQFNIEKLGYSRRGAALMVPDIDPLAPKGYPAAHNGLRVSTTIRFPANSTEVDLHAKLAIDELAEYLRKLRAGASHLLFVGFADDTGDAKHDEEQARTLASIVAGELERRGVPHGEIRSFGSQMPVANNATSSGRLLNRRVETWITAWGDNM
jgi:phosphate transport system substrate-binding protein